MSRMTVFAAGGPTATSTAGPTLNLGGGGSITWSAPTDGPFTNLIAWSDKVSQISGPGANATWHTLAGGGSINLQGVFFTPLARVNITGSSNIAPLRAQFWAGALTQGGSGTFSMTPDGSFILVPVGVGTRLIR
jgi:hypothetical protein